MAGFAAGLLAKYGLHMDTAVVDGALQGVTVPIYYALVSWLEKYYEKAGWLLGVRKAVAYVETHDTAVPAK